MLRRRIWLVLVLAVAAATAPPAFAVEPPIPDNPQVAATVEEAAALAASSGEPVMVASSLSRTSADYVNPDGTHTSELAAGAVREPDAGSRSGWSPVDASLITGSGVVTPRRIDASVVFTDGGLDGYLAKLTSGGDQVALDWLTSLPAPTLTGDTATYTNVYPGIDVELKALLDGFEQSFVVHAKPTAPLVFRIPLGLRGLSTRVAADGSLELVDAAGVVKADSDPAIMMDSSVDPASDEPVSVSVATHVVQTPSGPVIEVTPDMAFFDRPGLVYPVIVDPPTSLVAKNDTFVQSGSGYATTDNSSSTDLKVGTYGVDSGGTQDIARSLVPFWGGSSGIAAPAWAADPHTVVLDAQLDIFEYWASSCTAKQVTIKSPTSSWTASGVRWGTKPSIGGTVYAQMTASAGNGACATNITNCATTGHTTIPQIFVVGGNGLPSGGSTIHLRQTDPCNDASGFALADLVQGWVSGTIPNYGLYLSVPSETTDTATWKRFNSSNATANVPKISVTYVTIPSLPGALSPYAGQITATPTFRARYNDTLGGSGIGALRFTVYANATCTGTPLASPATAYYLATGDTPTLGAHVGDSAVPVLADGAYSYTVQGLAGWTDRNAVVHPSLGFTGLVGAPTGCVPFTKDGGPTGQAITSPTPGAWAPTDQSTPATWSPAASPFGAIRYVVVGDASATTDPTLATTGATVTSTPNAVLNGLPIGIAYIHVRAVDALSVYGPTATVSVNTAQSAPVDTPVSVTGSGSALVRVTTPAGK